VSSKLKLDPRHVLNGLFEAQDLVLREHLEGSDLIRDGFQLISDATGLAIEILGRLTFSDQKRSVISNFSNDAISAAVLSTRVALWGNAPEALAILRPAIERCIQLAYVIRERKYKIAWHEIETGSFKQVSYDVAASAMSNFGKRYRQLHGHFSELAANATAKRLHWSDYQHNGQQFARIGLAYDQGAVLLCLYYCMDIVPTVLGCLHDASTEEGPVPEIEKRVGDIVQRLREIKVRCDAIFAETSARN
jgi:hypothetical protein